MRKVSVLFTALAGLSIATHAQHPLHVPDINEIAIEETFGHGLQDLPVPVSNYLLAVSLDKTTQGSMTEFLPVGVPFIVDQGDEYWVARFSHDSQDLSSLINLSLILTLSHKTYFADQPLIKQINLDDLLLNTLVELVSQGYWPAQYFLAENLSLAPIDEHQELRQQTVSMLLNACSDVEFAPCQFRKGFRLLDNNLPEQGIEALKQAMTVYGQDSRYHDQDSQMVDMAFDLFDKMQSAKPSEE